MKIVSVIARYLLGLLFTVFGLNGFLQLHPSAAADEPVCDPVLRRHQCLTFCRILLRSAVDRRAAFALGFLRAARSYAACGGAL